jgi:hypothetical protein
MAEFKLGRIRFIWKDEWSEATTYYKDDVVRYGGKTFMCVVGHISQTDFMLDLNDSTAKWQQFADGQTWRGDWTAQTVYKINDIVKYGGQLYIANTGHISDDDAIGGLESNLGDDSTSAFWDLFGEGFDYKSDWAINTRYKVNDIVKYGSRVYICTGYHVSAPNTTSGLELNQSKWDIISDGFDWKTDWAINTRYRIGDLVKYGGQVYSCNTGHTSSATTVIGLEVDQSKWDYFHKGIEYLGEWASAYRYKINDVVKDSGGLWICTTYHTSTVALDLKTDESNWAQFIPGLEFEDSWGPYSDYQPGDIVTYGGYTYVSKTNNTEKKPSEQTADWDVFATGFNLRGVYGDDSAGQDYLTGDVVTVGGFTYLAIATSNGVRPPNTSYWEKLNEGVEWNSGWTTATYYDLGDVVSQGVNSYIAVQSHTSNNGVNDPATDTGGNFWNFFSGGAESGNLTTAGDIVYYGGSGPARLPVGKPGQVLKVNDAETAPEWTYFGQVNHIWYVDTNSGVDAPAPDRGITLDRPFKTIRFATEQIENGGVNQPDRILIEANRSFLQAEVTEWIDYQIANVISPFSGSFSYDKAKCVRDTGQIIDAVAWDLSRGGNVRSRLTALSYFQPGGSSYIAGQTGQTVAAISYLESIMPNILAKTDPAANYQALNSVSTPITQQKLTAYTGTSGTTTTISSLIDITTNAITAGVITGIPSELHAQKTIFVKTGTYFEVLPIIVPEDVAIVGDELRSTRISPASSITSADDTPKSIAALTRIEAVVSNIVQNVAITKSSGNSATQVTTRPAGNASAGTATANLFREIYDYIDWGINGVTGDSTQPTMRGSNTPETSTGYTYAVEVLEANKAFIIAEVHAFIAVTYSGYSYSLAACARDVTAYIDAVKHDLIYSGNYKSLLSAKYYVHSVEGCLLKNMFFVRNGTGLRNCTLTGLSGTLSGANTYGTKRPTAGAYVSLDPGWGPAHTKAWITNKSPYVQNVTTFGTACIGLKVDGDLHAGGNDSIVANDFTQILSDGIGYWVTNLGRSELVSVFTYYNHIGYLAEDGGKIRATNGNNSYGDFGSVAEGIDETETPVLGKVDNRQLEAQVANVVTDGANEILQLEYSNAGTGYTTEATSAIITTENVSNNDSDRVGGTYKGISATSSGSGSGQEFDVEVSTVGGATITVIKGGTGHVIGDTFTIVDGLLGAGGATSVTFDVATIGAATRYTLSGEGFGAAVDAITVRNGGVMEVQLEEDSSIYGGAGFVTIASNSQAGNTTQITLAATDVNPTGTYNGMCIYILSGLGAGQYGVISAYDASTKIATIVKESDGSSGWEHIKGSAIASVLDATTAYDITPRVIFTAPPSGITARGRCRVADEKVVEVKIIEPGSGYSAPPQMALIDASHTIEVPHTVRIGNGVLGQPTYTSRGTGFITAAADVIGDGFGDIRQLGTKIRVDELNSIPQKGANIEFASLPDRWFKLVSITSLLGAGPYSALLQVSPALKAAERPPQDDLITIRRRYSQVRLTGHDFLDIGTGNFTNTNYPGTPLVDPAPQYETNGNGGGRVFYTSTDQDGNFRVGGLFNVEQATGIATLNVEAFNISGLNELQLGSVALGGAGAVITEFSTDGTFSADSDSVVPTQKAIKTYITAQIGGGVATLNVNSVTAGTVEITANTISTTDGGRINILNAVNFKGGIDGAPVALSMFLNN